MLFSGFKNIFKGRGQGAAVTAASVQTVRTSPPVARNIQVAPPEKAVSQGTPVYPPIDPGILIVGANDILASQHDLISKLERNLGLPAADFEHRYLEPLRRTADLINLLPATRDKHHAGAGGLFRLCCAMAVRAAQSAEGRIFASSEGVERRREIESGWRHAAFLTGLTSELCRPLTEMIVLGESGEEWSPYVCGLTDFARRTGCERVYIRWHQRDDHRSAAKAMTSWAVNVVLGNDLLARLHEIKPLIVETIYGVVTGAINSADNNTMVTLINDVRRRVIERDTEIAPLTYGKLTQGAHLEPHLLDAMRSLIRTGKWKVNVRGSRCHYGSDGFFIAWRQGSDEIMEWLRLQNLDGIPASRETLEDLLGSAGVIAPGSDGSRLHMISAFGMQPFPAVRLKSPGSVIGEMDITPVANAIKAQAAQADAKKPTPAAASPSLPPLATPSTDPFVASNPTASMLADEDGVIPSPEVGPVTLKPVVPDPVPQAPTSSEGGGKERGANHAPGAKSSSPKSSQDATSGGEITPQKPLSKTEERQEERMDSMPAELLLDLGAPACRDLAVLRHAWNRGKDSASFLKTKEGLAVSFAWLDGNLAMPWPKLQNALHTAGYLQSSQVSGRTRLITQQPFPKGEEMGVVFLNAFLRKAGFELE